MQIVRVLAVAAMVPATLAAQRVSKTTVSTAEFRGLSVVSDRIVWASGARGTIARTVDGGDTWTHDTVPGASTLDFRAIRAFDANRAVALSAGEAEKGLAKIFTTRDGGKSWTLAYSTEDKGVFFDAMAFWDADNGVALSDPLDGRFVLATTRDGGRSWSRDVPGPATIPGEAAFAASDGNMVAMGQTLWIGTGGGGTARVLRSDDRGRTWTSADVPLHATGPASGIFAIAFADRNTGVAVGGDYTQPHLAAASVALTNDGGRTWRAAKAPPAAYLSSVAYAGPGADRLVATGLAGTFASPDSGETWVQVDAIPMNTVRFRNGHVFMVGPRGRVERWKP